jgi:prophage regulatory protein
MKKKLGKEEQPLPAADISLDLLPDRLLRLPQVLKLFPVRRSTWYAGIGEGRYPKGEKISKRSVGWRLEDILALVRECGAKE